MAATILTPTSASSEAPKLIKKAAASDAKTPSSPVYTTFGCQHVKSLLQNAREQATSGYIRLMQCVRSESNFSKSLYKSGGSIATAAAPTFLCLQCPNISSTRERHRPDHAFAAESYNGFLFCHECKDFVYDPTFEEIRSSNGRKRKHSALSMDSESKRLIAVHSGPTPCAATGLRGLYNMGQTCFMSVIVQSLIHNPLIRTFYLAEGHRKEDCEIEACTSCALDEIINEFFREEKHEGLGAVQMLQGCWKAGRGGLAGYSQQDAHEYLGELLDILHRANTGVEDSESQGHPAKVSFESDENCNCITHQTFRGKWISTTACTSCKYRKDRDESFMDLSVDIRGNEVSVKKPKLVGTTGGKLTNGTHKEVQPPMDLTECLDLFTSPETLETFTCPDCAKAVTIKLTLARLPPVLPIHVKRFSHSKSLSQSSKVETKIRFPLSLDLSPYSTSSTSRSKSSADKLSNGNGANSSTVKFSGETDKSPAPKPIFDLSSVVVHKGKIDNGHYISYSKQGDDWFRFDDSMVVQVDEREVLNAEAYMLFYVVREMPTWLWEGRSNNI